MILLHRNNISKNVTIWDTLKLGTENTYTEKYLMKPCLYLNSADDHKNIQKHPYEMRLYLSGTSYLVRIKKNHVFHFHSN